MSICVSVMRTYCVWSKSEWVRALACTGDRTVRDGFESHCGQLRFGTLAISFTPLCQCLSEETLKAVGPFYLVSMPGEVKDPTSPQWRGNDFSTGWSSVVCDPTFSSWGCGGHCKPPPMQRGPGQSPGGKRIWATIVWKLTENQVSGSPSTPLIPIR